MTDGSQNIHISTRGPLELCRLTLGRRRIAIGSFRFSQPTSHSYLAQVRNECIQELVYSRHGLRWLHVCWHVRTHSIRGLSCNFYCQESMVNVQALYIPRQVTLDNTFNAIRTVIFNRWWVFYQQRQGTWEFKYKKEACTISQAAKDFSDKYCREYT